jgi:outer membrane immunogenic protein
MFERIILASFGVVVLAGATFAAEPPPVQSPPPAFTWTGIYIGGQIGYAWANDAANAALSLPLWPRFLLRSTALARKG